jgi:hypothetical protein
LGTGLLTFAFFIFAAFEFARTSQFSKAISESSSSDSEAFASNVRALFRTLIPLAVVFLALVLVNIIAFVWIS